MSRRVGGSFMRKKGAKLPSVNIEGASDSVFEMREGRLVKVCGVCRTEMDRVTGTCPQAATH